MLTLKIYKFDPIEYRQVPHVFGKTFFGRRIDLSVILDFRGLIHPK